MVTYINVCILCMLFVVPPTAALWQTLLLHYGQHIAKLRDVMAEHVAVRQAISGYNKMPVFVVSR